MSYSSEVLADSPWGYWKTDEASGALADSSGNGRTMTVTGTPTYAQTGPDGATADAMVWPTGSHYAKVSAGSMVNPAGLTLEAWVYLTANPAGTTQILAQGTNATGTTLTEYGLGITTSGQPFLYIYNGGSQICSGSAMSLNTWHHVVGRARTSGGMDVRVDKVTTGTLAANMIAGTYARDIWIHASGYSNSGASSAVTIARPALYVGTALSNARLDAHYDALLTPSASGTASLSLSASGTAGATAGGSASLSLSASGAGAGVTAGSAAIAFSATGGTEAPAEAAGTASLALSASGGAAAAGGGTATLAVSAAGSAQLAAAGAATLTLSADGEASALYTTDTSNLLNGRDRGGSATVTVAVPVAAPAPSLVLALKVDKAVAYPTPTMVDGRPT